MAGRERMQAITPRRRSQERAGKDGSPLLDEESCWKTSRNLEGGSVFFQDRMSHLLMPRAPPRPDDVRASLTADQLTEGFVLMPVGILAHGVMQPETDEVILMESRDGGSVVTDAGLDHSAGEIPGECVEFRSITRTLFDIVCHSVCQAIVRAAIACSVVRFCDTCSNVQMSRYCDWLVCMVSLS